MGTELSSCQIRDRMEPRTAEGVEKVGDCAKPLLLGAPNGARSRVAPGDRTPFRGEGTRGQIAKPNGAPEGRKSSQVNVLSPLRGSRHVTLHPGFSHPGTGFGHPGLLGLSPLWGSQEATACSPRLFRHPRKASAASESKRTIQQASKSLHFNVEAVGESGGPLTALTDVRFRARLHSIANQAPNSAPFHASVRLMQHPRCARGPDRVCPGTA